MSINVQVDVDDGLQKKLNCYIQKPADDHNSLDGCTTTSTPPRQRETC